MSSVASSSQNTTSTPARKVAKRTATADAATAAAPVPVAAAAPAPAAAAAAPKAASRRASPAASVAAAVAAPAVTVTATPVAVVPSAAAASADAAAAAAETSLADEVAALQTQLTTIRDAASAALAALKRVTKRATQEVKEARKNRRRQRSEPADGAPRKPSNFEIPVPISDELSAFLGRGKNSSVSRASVNKSLNDYIKSHGLNQGQNINPDATLRKLLTVPEGESLTIFNIQKYMRRHFLKPAASATPAKA